MKNILKKLKNSSVLVLGFGKEGRDNLRFLRDRFPEKTIGIADKKEVKIEDSKVNLHTGNDYLEAVNDYDVIIKSPGIPMTKLEDFKDKEITSQSDIFLHLAKGKIIGVTGTKGKSTTCLSIYNILKKSGFKAYLLGNIGEPVLKYIDKEGIFIYELSSFQLQTVSASPDVAVLLNIFKDHLDQHKDFSRYVESKKNIFKFQNSKDVLIYNQDDEIIMEMIKDSKAKKVPFDPSDRISDSAVYLNPILKVGNLFDIKKSKAKKIINNLNKLPHRLEFIGSYKRIDFFDDSASTIPEATIQAIKNVDNLETLIVGGVDKGGDYKPLAEEIKKSNIKTVILFPDTGKKINKSLKEEGIFVKLVESMEKAVEIAYKETSKGKACVLSPASSSFNMFDNYKDRGEKFKKYVKEYA